MSVNLNRFQKGIILLTAGIILLLYSTGLITTGLHVIFIVTSLLMTIFGFYLIDGPQYLRSLVQKLGKDNTPTQSTQAPPPPHNTKKSHETNKKNNGTSKRK